MKIIKLVVFMFLFLTFFYLNGNNTLAEDIDTEGPVITGAVNFSIEVNSTDVDYIRNASAFDEVDGPVPITVHSSNVIISELGTYAVTLKAEDQSENVTYKIIMVTVEDTKAPVISGYQNYEVEVFTTSIDYLAGVHAIDQNDGEVSVSVDDSMVNLNQVGTYTVTLSAIDEIGNLAEVFITVTVYDDVAPTFTKYTEMFEFEIGGVIPDFYEGLEVIDNVDGIIPSTNIIIYDEYVNYNVDGIYPITYVVFDSSNNCSELTVYVNIYDTQSPILDAPTYFTVSLTNPEIDYLDGVTATDNVSGDITEYIMVDDSEVNYHEIGTYMIRYLVTDQSGNLTVVYRSVDVVEDVEAPIITGSDSITVEVMTGELNYLSYIEVNDDFDPSPTITIDDTFVLLDSIGTYEVLITVTDANLNISTKTIEIHVLDTTAPTIYGAQDYTVEALTESIDYLKNVYALDNYHNNVVITVDDSLVNLNQIGGYEVVISAIDSSFNASEITITVEVIDTTAPVFTRLDDTTVDVKNTNPDYYKQFDIFDADSSVLIDIDDSNVDFFKLGTYEITISATDSSGNSTSQMMNVHVVDNRSPIIMNATDLTIDTFENTDLLSHVYALDNYDQEDVEVSIDSTTINITQLGEYQLTYKAMDSSGNIALKEVMVTVVDKTAPVIHCQNLIINIFSENVDYLEDVEAIDQYDGVVEVFVDDSHVNLNLLGTYRLIYYAIDKSGNYSEVEVEITVRDMEAPVIYGVSDREIDVFSDNIDYLNNVYAEDNVDDEVLVFYDDTKVNFNRIGSYPVVLTAVDSSGNKSEVIYQVIVEDNLAPIIYGAKHYVVDQFSEVNYLEDIYAVDLYDGEVEVTVDDSNVDLSQTGIYMMTLSATDSSGNKTEIELTVTVMDYSAPVIYGHGNLIVDVFTETIDYLDGIYAEDANEGIVPITYDDSSVQLDKVGTYVVTFRAEDSVGNVITEEIIISVVDQKAPILTGHEDMSIEAFTGQINYLKDITITDNYDDQVMIIIDDSAVNLSQLGEYEVMISAIDSTGNRTDEIITVTVIDNTSPELRNIKDLRFELGSKLPDYTTGLIAWDRVDGILPIHVDDSNVILDELGSYDVTYTVVDSSGNTLIKTISVTVFDTEGFVFQGVRDKTVEVSSDIDYLEGISIVDNVDEDASIVVDSSLVDLSTLGSYPVYLTVTDSSGNETNVEYFVHVLDTTKPIISGYKDIRIKENTNDFDPLDNIIVTDNYDENLIINVSGDYDLSTPDVYKVTLSVEDSSQNQTEITYYLIVEDKDQVVDHIVIGIGALLLGFGITYLFKKNKL